MPAQRWDPQTYSRNARFVSEYGAALIDVLSPRPGERILDIGCGDGVLTQKLVAAGCDVVGIDNSPELVEEANRRGIHALVQDAESMVFDGEFDAAFSNAVLHWIRNAGAVLEGVYRSLKPGGRFAAEFGGAGNVATIHEALTQAVTRRGLDRVPLDPWYFPTADQYGRLLVEHGFTVKTIALFPRPTPLPGDMADWLRTFAQPFLGPFDETARQEVIDEVVAHTRPTLYDSAHGWTCDYVRLRFLAERALA